MKRVVLFDLGGTLVSYYGREEFLIVLRGAVSNVVDYLEQRGLLIIPRESVWGRVLRENYESRNHRVRPLEGRLSRIFELDEIIGVNSREVAKICRLFMQPIFDMGECFDDTKPTLRELKSMGFTMVVVSNTPWGSPSDLWREELKRRGLYSLINFSVFCRDVGWRKPARPIFKYVLGKLDAAVEDCIFVGDDPRWDIIGPKRIGMDAILINREGGKNFPDRGVDVIESLGELVEKIA